MNTTSVPLDLPHPTLDPRFDELIETYRAPLARLAQRTSRVLAEREAVTLCLAGLSRREITPVLGISENNVALRLTRARPLARLIGESTSTRILTGPH